MPPTEWTINKLTEKNKAKPGSQDVENSNQNHLPSPSLFSPGCEVVENSCFLPNPEVKFLKQSDCRTLSKPGFNACFPLFPKVYYDGFSSYFF